MVMKKIYKNNKERRNSPQFEKRIGIDMTIHFTIKADKHCKYVTNQWRMKM